jgi:chorismate synthase
MLRFLTAGESHGSHLTAIIEGLPAGLIISVDKINSDLKRRQLGYGRGARMKIESDTVEITSGVRFGKTLGSPVTLVIKNKDWENWKIKMSPEPLDNYDSIKVITKPRPGHADLDGVMKYGFKDIRDVLERASARETAARVAVSGVAKLLLAEFGVDLVGYIQSIGNVTSPPVPEGTSIQQIRDKTEVSDFRCFYPDVEEKMKQAVDDAKKDGDTLGGIFEIIVDGLPMGLGSYVQWDRKLDGRISQAIMSMPAIKGVEIGLGFEGARRRGSEVHDPIYYEKNKFKRRRNHAGGLEGGVSNGQRLIIRGAMKPISTLMNPLESVDLVTKDTAVAAVERSDVCAAPAAAVVGEAVIAIELAKAFQEKFGGDSIEEMKRNYKSFQENLPY